MPVPSSDQPELSCLQPESETIKVQFPFRNMISCYPTILIFRSNASIGTGRITKIKPGVCVCVFGVCVHARACMCTWFMTAVFRVELQKPVCTPMVDIVKIFLQLSVWSNSF